MTALVTQLLFWSIVVLVLQPFSLRLSLLLFLVIVHFDMSAAPGHTASAIGWENVLKAIVLPAVLLFRVIYDARHQYRWGAVVGLTNSTYFSIWLAFCAYVLVSVLWSPYKISGLKLTAALVSHSMIFFLFATAWITGRLKPRMLLTALSLSVVLALIQSYVLGNSFGGGRLTSFIQSQGFGQYIVFVSSILLWAWVPRSRPMLSRGLLLAGVGLLLVLNGSRSAGLGAVVMLFIWILWLQGRNRIQAFAITALAGIVLAGGIISLGISETNRFSEVARAISGDNQSIVEDVGTFRWRSTLYLEAWRQLRNFDLTDSLLGRGASSGALVGVQLARYSPLTGYRGYDTDALHPNAVLHSEFLRTYYEFGVFWGTALVFAVLAGIALATRLSFFASHLQRARAGPWAGPLVSTLPLLMLLLSVENIFFASAHAGTTAALLVLARYASYPFQYPQSTP